MARTMLRVFLAVLGILLVVFAAVAGFGLVQWQRATGAMPVYTGELTLAGAPGPVTIVRDAYAVPHIEAETQNAAAFALGFVHAQDRYWQMDLTRRAASGRVAEILGKPALGNDRFMRVFNFPSNARETIASLSPELRSFIEAYTDGVNAWRTSEVYKKPAEYILTMTDPAPWTPEDTVLVQKMLWTTLSINAGDEHAAMRAKGAENQIALEELMRAFDPPYDRAEHVSVTWADMARTLGLPVDGATPVDEGSLPPMMPADPATENSNNWVVSGAHSKSGMPLLANDPHLGFTMPGFWYLAHLKVGGENQVGATIPGLPTIIIGRNDKVAWGITNNHGSDAQDIYMEVLNPQNPDEYKTPDGWATFEAREETFNVRFGAEVTETYLETRHGPVIPDDLFSDPKPAVDFDTHKMAMAWTAFDGPDGSVGGIFESLDADDVESLASAFRLIDGPIENFVMADTAGNIGLIVPGKVPVRGENHETMGRAYVDGANPDNDWQGMIPRELTPYVLNPESGKIVTANAKVVPFEYPYYRGPMNVSPSRQQRIQDLIDATPAHDSESFKAIQLDTTARNVQDVASAMLDMVVLEDLSDDAQSAVDIMTAWDRSWDKEEAAPLIFATWVTRLRARIFEDDLGTVWPRFDRYHLGQVESLLSGGVSAKFCDDLRTEDALETCQGQMAAALEATTLETIEAHGSLEEARWGAVSIDLHDHLGLGAFPVVGKRLSRTTNRGAGFDAPNVGTRFIADFPRSGFSTHGPGLRFVVDMAAPDAAEFITTGGQSGHFTSPHYDDLLRLWENGDYIRIPTDLAEIDEVATMTISPAN
ncbi:MAG: penicillin acylase family protein [Pseudomonadota bacterium]